MDLKTINKNSFSILLNAAPDAMLVINTAGKILMANAQTEKMFGYSATALEGEAVEILIPSRYAKGHESKKQAFISAPDTREMGSGRELFARRKDGTEIPVEIALNYLKEEDETYVFAAIRDMTEKKASENKFKALLEAAPDAMIIADERGRIELVNAQTEKLFGYKREELIGQEIEILIPEKFAKRHPKKKMNFIASPEVREMGSGLELFARRKDGSEFEVEIALSYLKTAYSTSVSAAIRDISERKLLEKQTSVLASIVEFSNEAILSKNLEGEIISWNKGAENIFGYKAEDVIGKKLILVNPKIFTNKLAKFQNGVNTPQIKEATLSRKNGEKFDASVAFSPIKDLSGNIIGVSEIISDITEQKRASEKSITLDKINKELEIKLAYHKQLEDFAYICSHNLRAPVGNLNSLFMMYDQTTDMEAGNAIVEKIRGVTHNLTATLEELSKALSIKTDSEIAKDTLEFEALLLKQIENVGEMIADTKAAVSWDFLKCPSINYPTMYLESILLNLLTNSLKYRSPNRTPVIHFETFESPAIGCGMKVTDNGLGIDLGRYGTKIFGLHKTFHRNADARGVGLFITKAQIEALGGTITVDSEVDKGTAFTIFFNLI